MPREVRRQYDASYRAVYKDAGTHPKTNPGKLYDDGDAASYAANRGQNQRRTKSARDHYGESLGQVASQTLESMYAINAVTATPVLRPLIGMDKTEIIEKSKEIGTYETSIQPFEDCCTIFTPPSPKTRPKKKNRALRKLR